MKLKGIGTAYLGPFAIMALLLITVLVSARGMQMQIQQQHLDFLPAFSPAQPDSPVPEQTAEKQPEVLLLFSDPSLPALQITKDALNEMNFSWYCLSASDFGMEDILPSVRQVLICSPDLSLISAETLTAMINWVEKGGGLGLMTTPMLDSGFHLISRKLGITENGNEYSLFTGVCYAEDEAIFSGEHSFSNYCEDYALIVHLEKDCKIHMTTDDQQATPLFWSRQLQKGKIGVFNHNLLYGKDSRGMVVQMMACLDEALVYPIINAAMIFIDDFPAPQPAGFDEKLKMQYGYDVQGFYRNKWWPDMKVLALDEQLRYTGLLVETYNDNVEGPYTQENEDTALIRYYTSELLSSGGEIGLHGYNHQPLCLDNFTFAEGDDYRHWPSSGHMKQAITELMRYGKSFLPDARFGCYVPPSNYLSDEGYAVLKDTVPELRVISGLYLNEDGVDARVQEFQEEEDGMISLPRITSGMVLDTYGRMAMINEMLLHGVFSHFIHPDDVLDEERGATLGWDTMYASFSASIKELKKMAPSLRWYTASEGAAAIQRNERLQIRRIHEEGALTLELEGFHDEAWLSLFCQSAPARIENGEIYPMANGLYWLRATAPIVILEWEAAP